MEGYSNQPIPKEAAKQLLALDLEDKEILTYENSTSGTPRGTGNATSAFPAARIAPCLPIWLHVTCQVSERRRGR